VKECKISGLKSHDHHILFQGLFPLVIRAGMSINEVSEAIIDMFMFSRIENRRFRSRQGSNAFKFA